MKSLTHDRLRDGILYILKTKKMYKDNSYTVKQLAEDLKTNVRYIALVLDDCYGMNYKSFVNKFRVEDAMTMLRDKAYGDVCVEDIGTAVGFMNKQSFFTNFTKVTGTTPQRYRKMMNEE